MAEIGRISLVVAFVVTAYLTVASAFGITRRQAELLASARNSVYAAAALVSLAWGTLLFAFATHDFSLQSVAHYNSRAIDLAYSLSGAYASQEGSLLMWAWGVVMMMLVVTLQNRDRYKSLMPWVTAVMGFVATFFLSLLVFFSDPFIRTPVVPTDGQGLNPLLQNVGMLFHPPALYLGYVAFTVPFAFALAALITGQLGNEWLQITRRWTLFAWAFLSIGNLLGAQWAYVELGWGGYWGWDPVENSSLIPWLTATALLHSLNLYVKRGTFKRWTVTLATVTFLLTIVATWVTRSGVIESQHAFERAPLLSGILLGFMGVVAAVAAGLLATRWASFEAKHEIEAIASKDFMYYLNNVALAFFAALILFTTVGVPLIMHQTVQAQTYDTFARPLGIIFLAVIAACPLMAWRRTDGATLWRNLRWPLVGFVAALIVLAAAGWGSSVEGLIGLAVCVFAAVAIVQFAWLRTTKARGSSAAARLWNMLAFSRSRTGGLVSHIGMVLILVGLIGSSIYKTQTQISLPTKAGASATAGAYTVRFVSYREKTGVQDSTQEFAVLDVYKGKTLVGRVQPHIDFFPTTQQTAPRAVILASAWHDLFVAPNAFDNSSVTLNFDVFPLIKFLWIGVIVLVGGSAVSLWPARARVIATATDEARELSAPASRALAGEE